MLPAYSYPFADATATSTCSKTSNLVSLTRASWSRCFLRYSNRSCTLRCCAPSTAEADEALRSKRHITIEDLENPAHIGGSAKSEVAVQVRRQQPLTKSSSTMCLKRVSKACNPSAVHAFTFSAQREYDWLLVLHPVVYFGPGRSLPTRSARVIVVMQDFGNALSLEAYMQLPVEQYYELDPAMIRPLGGTRFALQVPRVNVGILLHIWRAHVLQRLLAELTLDCACSCSMYG